VRDYLQRLAGDDPAQQAIDGLRVENPFADVDAVEGQTSA